MDISSTLIKARAPNFTTKDERLVVRLVKKYKDILECKRSDANTNKLKMHTWEKLASDFNSECGGTYRSAKVIKNKYENLKRRTKEKVAKQKQEGGPSPNVFVTPVEEEVKEMIGVQLIGNVSKDDDDDPDTCIMESRGCSQRNDLKKKLTKWCQAKEELVKTQIQCLVEEHKLKLKHMQEAHSRMMAMKEEEHSLKILRLKR